MKRCIVSVGVNRVASHHFPPLLSAANDAREVHAWARGQGFDSTLLVDDGGTPVTVSSFFNAVDSYVQTQTYSQIVVYFSGHGILPSPGTEVWLLSGASANPNEAVNVTGSILNARGCAIPHVVIISDACRSMPPGFQTGQLAASVVFPSLARHIARPEVDSFFATLAGDVALEPAQPSLQSKSVFTECLLKALHGNPASIVEKVSNAGQVRNVVASRNLKTHLSKVVPLSAAQLSIVASQNPDIRVESSLPKYLAEVLPTVNSSLGIGGGDVLHQSPAPTEVLEAPDHAEHTEADDAHSLQHAWSHWVQGHTTGEVIPPPPPDVLGLRESVKNTLNISALISSRLETGLMVLGDRVKYAYMNGIGATTSFEENNAVQINFDFDAKEDLKFAYVRLSDSTCLVLPIISGYVGAVHVLDGRVLEINYEPSELNILRRHSYQLREGEIATARAIALSLAKMGSLHVDKYTARETISIIRRNKRQDPILGVLAAYAFAESGLLEEAYSVYAHMKYDENLIFDVAMLAAQVPESARGSFGRKGFEVVGSRYAPGMPLLRRGWLLLGGFEEAMPSYLKEARRHLLPGLWTHFAQAGADIIEESMKRRG